MTPSDKTLTSLHIDTSFIKTAHEMGLITLNDILDLKLPQLRRKKGFNYIWYLDLLELLAKQGLLEEFQRRQL